MAYFNGSVNSFEELRTAIFDACVAAGFTRTADIITKGSVAIRIINNTVSSSTQGVGLIFQGGTGISGGALTLPSPIRPRLGPPATSTSPPVWPMEYNIEIFDNPIEVYIVAKFNIDYHYWAAFGVSQIPLPNTGLWLSAICRGGQGNVNNGITINNVSGSVASINQASSGAIFWDTFQAATPEYNQDTINSGLDSVNWAGQPASPVGGEIYGFNAIQANTPAMARQPNAWNSEGILMKIIGIQWRGSSKCSVVCDLVNARYVRVDNYTPGQIVTLGSDRWKIYPFYRKDAASRNGGTNIDHTGTFGWAIRYDGP